MSLLVGNDSAKTSSIIRSMQTIAAMGNTVKTDGALAPVAITGTGDSTLPPPDNPQPVTGGDYGGYTKVVGLSSISTCGCLTVVDDSFLVGDDGAGDYHTVFAWIDAVSTVKSTTLGFVFATEHDGLLTFSQRPVGVKVKEANSPMNISGGGIVTLESGDKVSVWLAADISATITINDMNIGLKMNVAEALKDLL